MKSRTGRTTLLTRRLRAAQMPTGSPMATAKMVATTTSARVCIASTQSPIARIEQEGDEREEPEPPLALQERERDEHEDDDVRDSGR